MFLLSFRYPTLPCVVGIYLYQSSDSKEGISGTKLRWSVFCRLFMVILTPVNVTNSCYVLSSSFYEILAWSKFRAAVSSI